MPGTLYVVSTPIGNLEDLSPRARRMLQEVDLIAAEDARVTRALLRRCGLSTPVVTCGRRRDGETEEALAARLASGQTLALVCDAGTPGISDPGTALIRLALAQDAAVVPVPGPNAALAALVVSGLPAGRFAFDGFPPRARTDRHAFFQSLRHERRTLLLYESPRFLLDTLERLLAVLGDRPLAVARHLTKPTEEVYRGTLSDAIDHFRSRPRGELTLVIGPADDAAEEESPRRQSCYESARSRKMD